MARNNRQWSFQSRALTIRKIPRRQRGWGLTRSWGDAGDAMTHVFELRDSLGNGDGRSRLVASHPFAKCAKGWGTDHCWRIMGGYQTQDGREPPAGFSLTLFRTLPMMKVSGWCCRTELVTRANRLIFSETGLSSEFSAYGLSGASRALIPPAMASTHAWGYPRGPISCSTDGPRKGSIGYSGTLIGLLLSVFKRMTKNPTGFLVLSQVSKLRPVPPSLCAGMDVGYPPAHRDETAMNGAQLLKAQRDSSGLMSGPPAPSRTDVRSLRRRGPTSRS
jgi:hypothetical protein